MCASEAASHDPDHALYCCSYGSWYPRYAAVTPASKVIELGQSAEDFLHEDGLVLHGESAALPQRSKPSDIVVEGVDYDPQDLYSSSSSSTDTDADADTDSRSGSDDSADAQPWSQRFPALHAAVAAAISELGGSVAPRLNWSSPTDALWLTSSNSLKCTNPDEVLLLLKGSDRIAHDLEQLQQLHSRHPQPDSNSQQQQQQQQQVQQAQAQQQSVPSQAAPKTPSSNNANGTTTTTSSSSSSRQSLPAQLVLRSWCGLQHEWQFRAFVYRHRVVAISQRDPSQHFPQLSSAAEGDQHSLSSIQERLVDFHTQHIGSSFPLDSYAMDVHVPPRGSVQLLDFSPISLTTNPLCFGWDELPYQHMKQGQQQPPRQQSQYQSSSSQDQLSQQQQQQQQRQEPNQASSSGVQIRVVEHEGMIVPGTRVATGMPYDMLGLPDAMSAVMEAMQQQQLQ